MMDEPSCAESAMRFAIITLRERCLTFQQQIALLEQENINLRVQCSTSESNENNSLSEIDLLKGKIAELNEQNMQLQNKLKIVSLENRELWANLGKLTNVNKNLGTHLSKINDSLKQHANKTTTGHSPLIRSKTFTQDEPQTKVLQRNLEDNGKISMELEDISLKLMSSINNAKFEFGSLLQEMADIQTVDDIITNSLGFCYDDELDGTIEEFKSVLSEIKLIKEETEIQNKILRESIRNLENLKDKRKCEKCVKRDIIKLEDKSTSTLCLSDQNEESVEDRINDLKVTEEEKSNFVNLDKLCPICSRHFSKEILFKDFLYHVEQHFTIED